MAEGVFCRGQCSCGAVKYQVSRSPIYVHCCHCTWCQRETGSAFALNALIESSEISLVAGEPETTRIPSNSGIGQIMVRCTACGSTLWSHYGDRQAVSFLRVGTLDNPNLCPPDLHIFTSTKQQWVTLPAGAKAVAEFYQRSEFWSEESYARYKAAVG